MSSVSEDGSEAVYRPYIVAVGGTLRPNSSTEKALRIALAGAEESGARTRLIGGLELEMPMYAPERIERSPNSKAMVAELRLADGILLGSPGYHGGVSGLVKNALDYSEDMRADARPYFDGRPVGSIATGAGWQGAVTTLTALRGIVHALRGWNTPLGVAINTIEPVFAADGSCSDTKIEMMLKLLGKETADAARLRAPGARSQVAASEYSAA